MASYRSRIMINGCAQPGVHSRRISGTATVPEPRRRQRPRETANKSGNLAWRHCPRLLPSGELVRVPKTMDKHNACPWTFRSIDQTLYHAEPNLVIFSCMYLCTSQAYHIAQNKNPHAHHSSWMLIMHPMCSGCRASEPATSWRPRPPPPVESCTDGRPDRPRAAVHHV